MEKIKWGVLATGVIAHKFATGLKVLPDAALRGVGSRSLHKAEEFAEEFGFEKAYGSYEELVNDSEIDVIYIATPHQYHKENVMLCLNAGKAVICEKPFAINAEEAEEMIDLAREKGVFLMEAMWTRYIPVIKRVREWLQDGVIGDIRMLEADFGFRSEVDVEGRLFNPEYGGGALLDVGIYPLSFAYMVFGEEPEEITGLADIGTTGVDEQAAFLMKYSAGQLAVLSCAIRTETPQVARIIGTDGYIELPIFYQARSAALYRERELVEEIKIPVRANGYEYEAVEVMNCLRDGKKESEKMPLDETLRIMKTMDKIRAQWGLKYPMEE